MRGAQQRPCKFGPNCHKFIQGTCTYYHPPNDINYIKSQQPRNQRNQQGINSGFVNHSQQGNYPPQNHNRHFNQASYNQGDFNQHYRSQQRSKHFILNFNQFKEDPRREFKERVSNDDTIQKILCQNYHLGLECKFGENCRSRHAFTITQQQILRRLQFIRNIPFHPKCRLTKFKFGDKDYFALKNGIDVNFLDFDYQTKNLVEVFKYTFPDPNGKYNFYEHKNQYIFFSKDNYDTVYDDMGIYNILQTKTYYIPNSHIGKVTGIAKFDNNVFFSTSMSGQLKVWVLNGDQLVCHQQTMQILHSQFNPQNAKIQLYFVDISEINGVKVISVGTSDGRLLFFFGNQLNFNQVVLGQKYARVFKIRYTTRQNIPTALLLTWDITRTFSAVLEVDLVNFSIRPLVQVSTTEDQPRFMISLCEIVYGYLMVANLQGVVSIYSYPDTTNKIGAILHQNQITDIVCCQTDIKNTNFKMKTVFILEKMTEQQVGSLGIYVMK